MAEHFPGWLTAETMIPELVDRFFSPCVSAEGNTVTISLMRPEVVLVVPPEYRQTFLDLVKEFHEFAWGVLGFDELVDRYIGHVVDEYTLYRLECDIRRNIALYESEHEPLKRVLTRFLLTRQFEPPKFELRVFLR